MAVSLTADVQQRAKASGAGRFLGTGPNDLTPFPWRELTGVEAQTLLGSATTIADGTVTDESLELSLLQTVQASAYAPRGIGEAGQLKSAWVSGFGVTGSNPITAVIESHGLGNSLNVTGSPTLQSTGAIRIICDGATSTDVLSKPNVPELLTKRNVLVMDLNSDILDDWNAASLFRAFETNPGFGFLMVHNGIAIYTGVATTTTFTFTPKRGRQRIGVYIEFGSPSSFRYISLGRDENGLSRPPLKVSGTFASASFDPTGSDGLDVWVGEANLISGRAGTHDIYGWRLINGLPAGLTADAIDDTLLSEIAKLGRETDPLLRVLPTPVDAGNWAANINAQGFFLFNQSIGQAPAHTGTTEDVDPLHRGRLVPLSNVAGWTLTILNSTPPGDYYYKDTGGAGGTIVGGASVTLFTINSAGTGLTGVTSPSLAVLPNGRIWFRIEENAGSAPIGTAGGDLDVSTVFTAAVTFPDVVKVGTQIGTFRDIGAGSTIGAADNGKLLFATSNGTATISSVSILAPGSSDTFRCTVINQTAGNYVLDGPGASNVTLAHHESGTIMCKFGGSVRVYTSLGVVTS